MQVISERNLRSVDLNLLVAFDVLMAERNVTRAAARNGLSQPGLSRALSLLRNLFDDPLFVRRDRAMEPTARALALAGPIRGALAAITLASPAAFDPAAVSATVRIASIDLYHMNLLPSLVRHLRRHAPGVDLQVRANDCSCLREQLASGEIDLAFAPLGTGTGSLSAEPLWNDRLVTLVGPMSPLRGNMSIEDYAAAGHLADAGHVQVSPDGAGTSVVDAVLAARGLRRRIVLVLPSSAGVPFVVAATDLIATLPSRIVKGLAPVSHIRVLTRPPADLEVSPHMFWHCRTDADRLQLWLRAVIATSPPAM
ncbi:MAG TPA: LysR family transcriptional regulator [Xanthobacteraceae bacterium]|nr:LysR family transcriptional regulator [Xanthobacteraceae bacterium]